MLENERVRVLLTTTPPGATTPAHTHTWPSVEYVLSTTNFVRRDADQDVLVDTRRRCRKLEHITTRALRGPSAK